jgi:hypothetical protein
MTSALTGCVLVMVSDLVGILQKKEKILVYRLHPAFTCHFTCLHYDGLWKYHIYAGHSPGSIKGK